jgi:transposase-like protein
MKRERKGRRSYSSEAISEVIGRYRARGLGVARFAQQQGISPGRLHYWVYQKGRNRPPMALERSASAPLFQEVKVAAMLPGVGVWAAEVSLSRELTIRFSAAAAPGWIGSVVQALQRPC